MNILVLSAGTRNKIIQYFKRDIGENGKVIATDMSAMAPAIYEADNYYIVPKITDENYINIILDICLKEKINAVLSLIDPELSLIAAHAKQFEEKGITIVGSSYELCELALDKYKMFNWLCENGYKCAKSYIDKDAFYRDLDYGLISFPVFVKPIKGSGSIAISKVDNRETLELLLKHNDNLMIQEFLDGEEIGADVYIDIISKEIVSIFTKKKILMRAGETDKSISFKDDTLFSFIEKYVIDSGWTGQIDIDIFKIRGEYYISEVNPRFGGGYPHAYECGCNHMKLILNNIEGKVNVRNIGAYEEGLCMMKYNEIMVNSLKELR